MARVCWVLHSGGVVGAARRVVAIRRSVPKIGDASVAALSGNGDFLIATNLERTDGWNLEVQYCCGLWVWCGHAVDHRCNGECTSSLLGTFGTLNSISSRISKNRVWYMRRIGRMGDAARWCCVWGVSLPKRVPQRPPPKWSLKKNQMAPFKSIVSAIVVAINIGPAGQIFVEDRMNSSGFALQTLQLFLVFLCYLYKD
jgi:hypothetical protein